MCAHVRLDTSAEECAEIVHNSQTQETKPLFHSSWEANCAVEYWCVEEPGSSEAALSDTDGYRKVLRWRKQDKQQHIHIIYQLCCSRMHTEMLNYNNNRNSENYRCVKLHNQL